MAMNHFYRLLMACVMFAISNVSFAQLSEKEKLDLMNMVRLYYNMAGSEGTQIFKTKSNYVLVDLETMRSTINETAQARSARMKATRTMGEFLKGAKNKSVSVYETRTEETEDFDKKQADKGSMESSIVGSETFSSVEENKLSSSSESFSDKVIQTAHLRLKGVQSLMNLRGQHGESVYCYYLILSNAKAKKKQ